MCFLTFYFIIIIIIIIIIIFSRTFRTLDFYLEKRYWILHFIYYYYLMFLSLLADFKEELVKRC